MTQRRETVRRGIDADQETNRALILLTLMLGAFLLRALGADYGYFHGDEPIGAAARVLNGQLVPAQHFYPPLVNYIHAAGFASLFGVGLMLGWWEGIAGFRDQYFQDPTIFYVTARLLTAAMGALIAPLFYLIARRAGVTRRLALLVGLVGVLFPLGVFMSHIAKGDVALATSLVALIWSVMARLDAGRPGWLDGWIGVFVVLALSFKHSSLFVLLPLALGVSVVVFRAECGRALMRSLGRILVTGLISWPVLNIGQILDFANFLEFQRIQSVMSVRMEGGILPGLMTFLQRTLDLVLGLNPVHAAVAAAFPVLMFQPRCKLRHKPVLLVSWGMSRLMLKLA